MRLFFLFIAKIWVLNRLSHAVSGNENQVCDDSSRKRKWRRTLYWIIGQHREIMGFYRRNDGQIMTNCEFLRSSIIIWAFESYLCWSDWAQLIHTSSLFTKLMTAFYQFKWEPLMVPSIHRAAVSHSISSNSNGRHCFISKLLITSIYYIEPISHVSESESNRASGPLINVCQAFNDILFIGLFFSIQ